MTALAAARLGVLTPVIDLEAYGPTSAISEAELVRGYSRAGALEGEPVGKIIASYLVKVHLRGPEADDAAVEAPADGTLSEPIGAPTNDLVKAAVIAGLENEFGVEVTVSLIERTDNDQ